MAGYEKPKQYNTIELKASVTDWGESTLYIDDDRKTFGEASRKRASITTPNGVIYVCVDRVVDGWVFSAEVPGRLEVRCAEFED